MRALPWSLAMLFLFTSISIVAHDGPQATANEIQQLKAEVEALRREIRIANAVEPGGAKFGLQLKVTLEKPITKDGIAHLIFTLLNVSDEAIDISDPKTLALSLTFPPPNSGIDAKYSEGKVLELAKFISEKSIKPEESIVIPIELFFNAANSADWLSDNRKVIFYGRVFFAYKPANPPARVLSLPITLDLPKDTGAEFLNSESQRIENYIKQLGDEDFDTREQAEKGLSLAGDRALQPLQDALKGSEDLEFKQRGTRILNAIQAHWRSQARGIAQIPPAGFPGKVILCPPSQPIKK